MVELSVRDGRLRLRVVGLDKLWAMRSRLDIGLASVVDVRVDPAVARGLWKGVSAPGTHIPGLIIAGTFYQDDKRIFWDVHDPDLAVVIELTGERYDQLIVQVRDPQATVRLIEEALSRWGEVVDVGPLGFPAGRPTGRRPAGTGGGHGSGAGEGGPAAAARNG